MNAFAENQVLEIPLGLIEADPGQPRKIFDPTALSELAASIRAGGLLQPITVRSVGEGRFWVVAGERRFRAHQINKAATIRAIVATPPDNASVRVAQIVENDCRADVTPLEQARSYQGLMDETGWSAEALASRLGKAVHRITERTDLLRLREEYQKLLASGALSPSAAWEMARLSPRGQDTLFKAIRTGTAKSQSDIRSVAAAILDAENQTSLLGDEAPAPSEEDVKTARGFEAQAGRIAALLRAGISDNQVVAVRKVNPDRASGLADLFAQMQKDLRRIEVALRQAAVQSDFLTAA